MMELTDGKIILNWFLRELVRGGGGGLFLGHLIKILFP